MLSASWSRVSAVSPVTEGPSEEVGAMWDVVEERHTQLSHDLPCVECGHALHTYLPCSDACSCRPQVAAGSVALRG